MKIDLKNIEVIWEGESGVEKKYLELTQPTKEEEEWNIYKTWEKLPSGEYLVSVFHDKTKYNEYIKDRPYLILKNPFL